MTDRCDRCGCDNAMNFDNGHLCMWCSAEKSNEDCSSAAIRHERHVKLAGEA